MISDNSSVQQVLGCLCTRPQLLSQVDKYNLSLSDFSTRFFRYLYSAIYGLYYQGATKIEPIDIANYLESDTNAKLSFEQNHGVEYIQDAKDFSDIDNFDYYYNRLKKINLLRDLSKQGFDINDYYCDDLTNPRAEEINRQFELLSTKDICDGVKRKLLKLETDYSKSEEVQVENAVLGMRELIENMAEQTSLGMPLQGDIYSKVVNGAEAGALYIRSGQSGLGKAIPNSERIPTPDGWKTIGDIRVGDFLIGQDGRPTKVLGVYPQNTPKKVYQVIFESGKVAKCCEEHLWSYYRCNVQEKLYTKSLREIYEEAKKYGYDNHYLVPNVEPTQFPKKDYDIAPYLIGETLQDEPIPEKYLFGSLEQRSELLAGLLNKHSGFCITSCERMKNDIMALISSLGYGCKCQNFDTSKYRIEITSKRTDAIIDIKETDEFVDMTCFQVDNYNHLFVAGDTWWTTHNTRTAVADACYLAYPVRYDGFNQQWVQNGSCEKVLFIITEQSYAQIRKMILAYLTDINESRFKLANFGPQERQLIDQALEIMEKYRDNFIIIKMPNPTIELLKVMIRENCLLHNISAVFFDYIFINPAFLNEFKGAQLRNDELLALMSAALKDLAVELNVAMFTSTQVNAAADDNRNIRNEASLAGGRATINKADNGAIMARPTREELEALRPITDKYGIPNIVTDIFKVRSGEWSQVRIWSKMNLGTLKRHDLFITDAQLNPIEGFNEEEAYMIRNWDDDQQNEIEAFVERLNNDRLQSNN